ncbi:MAG: hypothetical protein ALAOOOJD_03970 [bacterium]|nr:hypothetical protein [bacterium]
MLIGNLDDGRFVGFVQADGSDHLRIIFLQYFRQPVGGAGLALGDTRGVFQNRDAIQLFRILVILIVTPFILYVEQNHAATGQANGQTKNINERIGFVLEQISGSDFEVVFEHTSSVVKTARGITIVQLLFVAQRIHRIRQRRFEGTIAHGREREKNRE